MKITIQDARTSVTLQQRDFRVTISGARGPAGPAGPSEWGGIDGDIEDQTDLYSALQAKVPYTGATQDVNLGEYGAQLGNLEFDNTPTNVPTTAGSVYWNDTDGTLNLVLKGGQTISRIGETQHIRALNNTGSQIARGKVVYVVGAQGQRLTIALADADTEILSKDTIGFTAEAIADGAEGFVIVQGVINNVSTTGMTDGATVYLSQTAGGYTTTAPTDPAHLVVLGFIVNGGSGGAGSIYVKVDNGYELEELHGVADAAKVTPVGADALLLRDSEDNNLWKRLTWTNALAGVKSHMDTFKSVAGGYASLDGSGKVPASELPSYVDDVVEVANYAALPGTGETGKIYVTLDTNKCYRWTGSVYVEVSAGGGVDTLTTTGTSGAATLVGSTLNIPQYQGVLTNPVTGTGTAGQVAYFNGTSAVTGSSSLVWDAANGRLGINTNSPTKALTVTTTNVNDDGIILRSAVGGNLFSITRDGSSNNTSELFQYSGGNVRLAIRSTSNLSYFNGGNFAFGTTTATGALLTVRGSGTTSATTALLVQNSTPSELFKVLDNGATTINGLTSIVGSSTGTTPILRVVNNSSGNFTFSVDNTGTGNSNFGLNIDGTQKATIGYSRTGNFLGIFLQGYTENYFMMQINPDGSFQKNRSSDGAAEFKVFNGASTIIGAATVNASAILQADSTTKGFLPPRMTTTQRDAIATPAAGLIVYNSTNSSIDLYTSAWRSLVSTSNYDGMNIAFGTTTGTKIGTATNQLIGLWNATPIAQPTTAVAAATRVGGAGNTVTDTDTFDGYTIAQLVKALRNMGALA